MPSPIEFSTKRMRKVLAIDFPVSSYISKRMTMYCFQIVILQIPLDYVTIELYIPH